MKTKNTIVFTSSMNNDGRYHTLSLTAWINEKDYEISQGYNGQQVYFSWQSDRSNFTEFYGGEMRIQGSYTDGLIQGIKLLNKSKIIKADLPLEIAGLLKAAGGIECTYDPRINEYVPLTEAKPESWQAWRDNHELYQTSGGFHVRDIYPGDANTEDIQGDLERLFQAYTRRWGFLNEYHNWIKADRPIVVCCALSWQKLDLRSLEDKVNS